MNSYVQLYACLNKAVKLIKSSCMFSVIKQDDMFDNSMDKMEIDNNLDSASQCVSDVTSEDPNY